MKREPKMRLDGMLDMEEDLLRDAGLNDEDKDKRTWRRDPGVDDKDAAAGRRMWRRVGVGVGVGGMKQERK